MDMYLLAAVGEAARTVPPTGLAVEPIGDFLNSAGHTHRSLEIF